MSTAHMQTSMQAGRPRAAGGGNAGLTIGQGQVFALLGPNGAGKTTLIEILEGHRRPDEGMVSVLGFAPGRSSPAIPGADRRRLAGGRARPHHDRGRGRAGLLGRLSACEGPWARPGAGRAGRPGGRAHRRVVGRAAPPAGPGAGGRRGSGAAVPGRADHRLRPVCAQAGVGAGRPAAGTRQDGVAHHPLPGGGALW
jgi:energy-coupling factor transporter ATP-binding protein EcfA2